MNMSNKAVRCEASAASCEYSVRYGGSAKHGAMPAYCHDSYAAEMRSTEQRAAYIIIFIAAASLPPFSPLPEAAPVQ